MANDQSNGSIWDTLGQVVATGASIYGSILQSKQSKAMIKAQTNDFPQLGMGLAATGPQRSGPTWQGAMDAANPFGSGMGVVPYMLGAAEGGSPVSMPGPVGARGLTQYVVYTTPRGTQRVTGVRSIGTPMLWSGDLAAVKRVARVARKLGRFVHHRRPR